MNEIVNNSKHVVLVVYLLQRKNESFDTKQAMIANKSAATHKVTGINSNLDFANQQLAESQTS